MEAKDTVKFEVVKTFHNMTLSDINNVIRRKQEAQAEISFKAGLQEGEVRLAKRISYPHWQGVQDAKQEGIREVVEFSNDICVLHGDADARTRQGRVLRKGHCKMCWETQLKAWGIEIDHQG